MADNSFDLAHLPWLPAAPADFRQLCRALEAQQGAVGNILRQLSSHALDGVSLGLLAKRIRKLSETDGTDFAPLDTMSLAVVGMATTSTLAPAIIGTAPRHGMAVKVTEGEYGQILHSLTRADSEIFQQHPQAILLALDARSLPFPLLAASDMEASAAVDEAVALVEQVCLSVKAHSDAQLIVQTVPPLPMPIFGSLDREQRVSHRAQVQEFNQRMGNLLAGTSNLLLDIAALAETVGLQRWHDPRDWHMAKLPCSERLIPVYADHVCRLLAAIRGRTRKCLVLDLDNTLWGGVIGDDGVEGIRIGQGDALGEAHLEIQRTAQSLRQRGVILAASSKNTEEAALQPFREHPDMLLREQDFSVFQANWTDKAANLQKIAQTLEIGLDSLVLLDDNPFERSLVRSILPEVAVPELPEDAALFAPTLLAAGYFEATSFTETDRTRAGQYRANAERNRFLAQSGGVEDYLASLQMRMIAGTFSPMVRPRVVQLIARSNQFNLTTKRYTDAQIAAMESDSASRTFQARLVDKLGDNGIISVVICRSSGSSWDIDAWLMSCRVLRRGVENAMLNLLVNQARAESAVELRGSYIATSKNALVRDHYRDLGFELVSEAAGRSDWRLALDRYEPAKTHIETEWQT